MLVIVIVMVLVFNFIVKTNSHDDNRCKIDFYTNSNAHNAENPRSSSSLVTPGNISSLKTLAPVMDKNVLNSCSIVNL